MANNSKKDYYEILGITEEEKKLKGDAFSDVVKSKYRKLAVKYHPDKWVNSSDKEKKEAEEKFKQINEANMVLSDPQKRERYDMGDVDGFDFPDFSNFNPFGDDFSPFSGGFGSFFGRGQRKQVEKGEDIQVVVYYNLSDTINGAKKTIKFKTNTPCSHCNGTGNKDGKDHKCPHCNGTGRIAQTRRQGNAIFQNITGCPYCGGTGRDMSGSVEKCHYCNGSGYETKDVTMDIEIPEGVFNGATMAYTGRGGEPRSKDGVRGDLIIEFRLADNEGFEIDGNDLIVRLDLDLDEALCGCEKEIKAVNGNTLRINIPELSEYGKVLRVRGKGIKSVQYNNVLGDLLIEIRYKKLNSITEKQKKLIKEFYGR